MYIRLLSDLHIEICEYEVEPTPQDSETVLILAGDCGLYKHIEYADFVQELAGRFRIILLVAGNHEWYSGKMHTERDKFEARVDRPNVWILQNNSVEIDGVLFLGGTLWTSFQNGNPIMMFDAENSMNDYSKIRVPKNGYRRLRALDVLDEHMTTRNFIFDTLEAERDDYEKVVVITHHAPSHRSIAPEFKGDRLNEAYVNNYDHWIEKTRPTFWFHGHTHSSHDYMIGETRVICNPRGYARADHNGVKTNENADFNPTLLLEV